MAGCGKGRRTKARCSLTADVERATHNDQEQGPGSSTELCCSASVLPSFKTENKALQMYQAPSLQLYNLKANTCS
jgi:hypothetical protein